MAGWKSQYKNKSEKEKEKEKDTNPTMKDMNRKIFTIRSEKILRQDAAEQNVFGVVVRPDVPASDGVRLSREAIRRAAHGFLVKYRTIGYRHREEAEAYPIESYVTMVDMEVGGEKYPAGSWMLGVHVNSKKIWQEIESGEIVGFSLGGMILDVEEIAKAAA